MGSVIYLKFRTSYGDLGPFEYSTKTSIPSIKDRLYQDWPLEGLLAKEKPSSAAELRFICCGVLKHLETPSLENPVTMHLIVRPPPMNPKGVAAVKGIPEKSTGCMCAIM